jgi:hypothetical protein
MPFGAVAPFDDGSDAWLERSKGVMTVDGGARRFQFHAHACHVAIVSCASVAAPIWFRTWMQKFAASGEIGMAPQMTCREDSRCWLSFFMCCDPVLR